MLLRSTCRKALKLVLTDRRDDGVDDLNARCSVGNVARDVP